MNYNAPSPRQDRAHANAIIDAEDILRKYRFFPEISSAYEYKAVSGIGEGTKWLKNFEDNFLKIQQFSLTIASSDESINDQAEAMARKCHGMFHREFNQMKAQGQTTDQRVNRAVMIDSTMSKTFGVKQAIKILKKRPPTIDEVIEGLLKLSKTTWWRRQIKELVAVKMEVAARELGLVCKKRGGYCSGWSLKRRRYQRRCSKALLASLSIENELGQTYTLDEVAQLGLSHLPNRRAELMTRLSGFESLANNDVETVWEAVFITQTTPSRFHSHNQYGQENKKWDRSTPLDAHNYLTHVWGLTRTAWDDAGIKNFGFRIAEPHHDGCPHWHIILWMPAEKINHAIQLFRSYALIDSGNERGAQKRRFTAEIIDNREGRSATGYVAKYVSKNIDGLGDDGQAWSADSVRTASRVDAWRSTWGLRQFQQIGGASVTVWRELRRLSETLDDSEIELIRHAADEGDWELYTKLMGGVDCKRIDRPLKPVQRIRSKANEYGQQIRFIWGLVASKAGTMIQTHLHEWRILPKTLKPMVSATGNHAPP